MKKLILLITAIGLFASCSSTKVSSTRVNKVSNSSSDYCKIQQTDSVKTQEKAEGSTFETERNDLMQANEVERDLIWFFWSCFQRN